MPLQKHKHHDVIVKWAQGYPIQWLCDGCWLDLGSGNPGWGCGYEYRVKPKPVIKKYRVLYKDTYGDFCISDGYYKTLGDFPRKGLQLLESLSANFEGGYDEPQ